MTTPNIPERNINELRQIQQWTEALQRKVIGEPLWIEEKKVFEYPEVTVEVVSILKLIRAVQSLSSLELLCSNGLFIDMCTIYRCVADCVSEIHFLLEKYPEKSHLVEKYIANFSQTTIDQNLNSKTEPILSKKVHSAEARLLSKYKNHNQVLETIRLIYKGFSGYVHSNYSDIMQVYGGSKDDLTFNLGGVPSDSQKLDHFQLVDQAVISVRHVIAFMADTFGQHELYSEIRLYI
ncbi:MAG: hypothetical protein ABSG22_08515 [Sedimentisphaerales bacterium]